jgi:hypothetical protein
MKLKGVLPDLDQPENFEKTGGRSLMKKKDLATVLSVLNSLDDVRVHPRFAYALAKNKKKIREELEDLQMMIDARRVPGFSEYEQKRHELCRKYSEKDEMGNPKTQDGSYVISDMSAFNSEFVILKEKYKEAITEFDAILSEANKILDEE